MENQHAVTLIENNKVIARLMQEFATFKARLLIKPSDSDNPRIYHSSIVRYDKENPALIIHQPKPAEHSSDLMGQEVLVSCQLHSGHFEFQTVIGALGNEELIKYSCLSPPAQIKKQQLRSYFRISLVTHQASMEACIDGEEPVHMNCVDLSQGGALCQLNLPSQDIPGWMTIGKFLPRCRLTINDLLDISCQGKITRVSSDPRYNTLVGIEFTDLSDEQLDDIGQTINKLERRNLQQMAIA